MTIQHQVVDLRVSGAPHQFTSQAQETEHHERLAAFRADIPRHVRFVVGPGQRVLGRDGTWRGDGTPIAAADVPDESGYPTTGRPGWRCFEDMLAREQVIENYDWRPPADAQQHGG